MDLFNGIKIHELMHAKVVAVGVRGAGGAVDGGAGNREGSRDGGTSGGGGEEKDWGELRVPVHARHAAESHHVSACVCVVSWGGPDFLLGLFCLAFYCFVLYFSLRRE